MSIQVLIEKDKANQPKSQCNETALKRRCREREMLQFALIDKFYMRPINQKKETQNGARIS